MFNGSITEAIQNAPAELREIIYKEYLTLKIKETSSLGFGEAHREIKSAPFCEKGEQITQAGLKLRLVENATSADELIGATCVLKMQTNIFWAILCSVAKTSAKTYTNFWNTFDQKYHSQPLRDQRQEVFVILYQAPPQFKRKGSGTGIGEQRGVDLSLCVFGYKKRTRAEIDKNLRSVSMFCPT